MDVFFSCPLKSDDVVGVLKTIILFLESLSFSKTSEILRKECEELGFGVSNSTEEKFQEVRNEETTHKPISVYYSNVPSFKNASEKSLDNKESKKSVSTCFPLYENVSTQYETFFEDTINKPPINCFSEVPPQNGSGESKVEKGNKTCAFGELLEKFKKLQAEHVKMMGITAELVKALRSTVTGQTEFHRLMEKCKEVYPDLFVALEGEEDTKPIGERTNAEVFHLAVHPKTSEVKLEIKRSLSDTCLQRNNSDLEIQKNKSSKSLENLAFEDENDIIEEVESNKLFEIDYGKLKNDLLNADDRKKTLILQALRWRITKPPPDTRESVIGSYIKHDLLCLQAPFREKVVFLESLYCPKTKTSNHHLQESIGRLVNAFASLSAGRDYLCQHENLLTYLLLPLILGQHQSNDKLGPSSREMLLATLQKLSLRYHCRQRMIAAGLVEFLIGFLNEEHARISVYCLEYCTALLMNLCLHKEGRSKCAGRTKEVMKLIKNLLGSKHAQVIMPYISGTMYSLLGNRRMNMEAKQMDLGNMLKHHIKQSDGENKQQLEYILKIHLEGGSIKQPDPKMEGDEMDLLEPELEENDPVKGDVNGEELLIDYKIVGAGCNLFLNSPTTPRPRSVSIKSEMSEKQPIYPQPSQTSLLEPIEENIATVRVDSAAMTDVASGSADESFSEETKQFYHKPSKKKGIFDRKKLKFPKNPYRTKIVDLPNGIRNPGNEVKMKGGYVESVNVGLTTYCGYRTCEHGHQNSNKYSCCCYEAMKTFVDNGKGRCDSACQTDLNAVENNEKYVKSFDGNFRDAQNPACASLSQSDKNLNVKRQNGKLCNVMLELQTDSSIHKISDNVCFLEDKMNCCKCYNLVFQSRPRIVRTPPKLTTPQILCGLPRS